MANQQTMIIVTGTKDATEAIHHAVQAQTSGQSQLTERRNLSGEAATWIVVASLAAQTLPSILTFLKDYAASRRIAKLKIGDWEVENPTPEILERFLARMDAQSSQAEPNEPSTSSSN
jgi:hypothetical protein